MRRRQTVKPPESDLDRAAFRWMLVSGVFGCLTIIDVLVAILAPPPAKLVWLPWSAAGICALVCLSAAGQID